MGKPTLRENLPWLPFMVLAWVVMKLAWLLFQPIALSMRLYEWLRNRRLLSEGKARLAFITDDDVPEPLRGSRPRRHDWRLPHTVPDGSYYMDLLRNGSPAPVVVVHVSVTQQEDFQTCELVYVLRHPDGRVELVLENNGPLWSRLKARPGDTFTALVNTRGEHVIYETLPIMR